MHLHHVNGTTAFIPVPHGWVVTEDRTPAGTVECVTIAGSTPDTSDTRNKHVTIRFAFRPEGFRRHCKVRVTQEQYLGEYDYMTRAFTNKKWRRRGYGGPRLTHDILSFLLVKQTI